jgi:RNA polymerase sigma factor for flagellar operon FliA
MRNPEETFMETASHNNCPTLPPRERAKVMMTMVKNIAQTMVRRLPKHIHVDELIGAGGLGLAEAYRRRGTMTGQEFEYFASCRIRGAMLDQLRAWDPLSRKQRRTARVIEAEAAAELHRSGEPARAEDVVTRLGLSERALRSLRSARTFGPTSMEALPELAPSPDPSPEDLVSDRQRVTRMLKLAEQLPAQQKLVVQECYVKDHSQREVADMLGITESRVSQIHTKALESIARKAAINDAERRCA